MSGHLEDTTQRNKKLIHQNWGTIKQKLNVADVIDPLIEAGVVDVDRWVEMKKIRSEIEKVEELLVILTKQPSSIPVFYRALKNKNHPLAIDLQILEDSNSPVHKGTNNQNGDTQNQGASSNRPDDYVRTSHLTAILDKMALEMRNNVLHVAGAVAELKNEMQLFREEYKQLKTKYVKLLESMCGDESSIGERKGEFQQLLQVKEALQLKLEISNVRKKETEEELKEEKIKYKELDDEHGPLNKEIDELEMEYRRLEKKLETLLATGNRNNTTEEIHRIWINVSTSRRFLSKLTRKNQEIIALKTEIIYLENRLGIPSHDSYFRR